MNEFDKQLERSARRLRDRRNATLDVPPCPRRVRRRFPAWAGGAAAACIGFVAGLFAPGGKSEAPALLLARVDTVVCERLVRDTVVREVTVAATGKTTAATAHPGATMGSPGTASDVSPRPSVRPGGRAVRAAMGMEGIPAPPPVMDEEGSLYVSGDAPAGRNMQDDSVNYSLLVRL